MTLIIPVWIISVLKVLGWILLGIIVFDKLMGRWFGW